jgi:CubicO group peptidase (beta-lactamase class C family)
MKRHSTCLSRREFAAGASAILLSSGCTTPGQITNPDPLYKDVLGDGHQWRYDIFSKQGYRLISLSAYGPPNEAQYAAVWKRRPGPAWVGVHGLSSAQYQDRFNTLSNLNYAPVLVTATGPDGNAVFAAVLEQVTNPSFSHHRLTFDQLVETNKKAFDEGKIPLSLAAYGTPDEIWFAGAWVTNVDRVPWAWYWADPVTHQRYFEASVRAGMRPTYVSEGPNRRVLSVFRDQPIGEWATRHDMTIDQRDEEIDTRRNEGFRPLLLQSSGVGAGVRSATLFARSDQPIARLWTVTGAAFAGSNELDTIASDFMKLRSIRAMSIAVARGGRVVANRGYTWAEPGYPVTQPDTRFRVASVTKLFTCAAIYNLVPPLTPGKKAFPYLGITSKLLPDQTPDPQIDQLTVEELVAMSSGLAGDFDFRWVASRLKQNNPARGDAPVTRDELVRFTYGEKLPNARGTFNYSNLGYTVLTSIIEKAAGQSFVGYLNSKVLAPLGIYDVDLGRIGATDRLPNEVATYDAPGVSRSALNVAEDGLDPDAYGGTFVMDVGEGAGSLIMSSGSIARMISHYSVWIGTPDTISTIGTRRAASRYGDLAGTGAIATTRVDDLDLGCAFNRYVTDQEKTILRDQINGVLDRHGSAL